MLVIKYFICVSFPKLCFQMIVFICIVNGLCQMCLVESNWRLKHMSLRKASEDCTVIATVLVTGISRVL